MKHTSLAVVSAIALALAGCGGGGSTSTPAAPVPPVVVVPPAPTVTPADIQLTVPAPTYAAGSPQLAYFNAVNAFRGKLGLGLLAQSAALDSASANHAAYINAHPEVDYSGVDATGTPFFHLETPGLAAFTGIKATDRAAFTNYGSQFVSEEGALSVTDAAASVGLLINSVFHREGLMLQSIRDVGVAFPTSAKFGTILVTMGGYKTKQTQASDYIGVYPADQQTGLPLSMTYEIPSPFADVNGTNVATATGSPISISSAAGTSIVATSFTVTENGQTVPLDVRTSSNATNPSLLGTNSIYITSKTAYKPNTKYNVSFTGSVNGKAVTKAWSFTTA